MDLEHIVRFDGHPEPFEVIPSFCGNPDCICRTVQLRFREMSKSSSSSAQSWAFSLSVHLDYWTEIKPPERSPRISKWVRDFLAETPDHLRSAWRDEFEAIRADARHLANYTLEPESVYNGELVSYPRVMSARDGLQPGETSFTMRFFHEEREFLVEDKYCPCPTCDCHSVCLGFWEAVQSVAKDGELSRSIHLAFVAALKFKGDPRIEECLSVSKTDATRVFAAWCSHYRDDSRFPKRYDEVKEIGRRSVRGYVPQAVGGSAKLLVREPVRISDVSYAPEVQVSSPRRNDSCPCGSGKKYKRCCGRQDSGSSPDWPR